MLCAGRFGCFSVGPYLSVGLLVYLPATDVDFPFLPCITLRFSFICVQSIHISIFPLSLSVSLPLCVPSFLSIYLSLVFPLFLSCSHYRFLALSLSFSFSLFQHSGQISRFTVILLLLPQLLRLLPLIPPYTSLTV